MVVDKCTEFVQYLLKLKLQIHLISNRLQVFSRYNIVLTYHADLV